MNNVFKNSALHLFESLEQLLKAADEVVYVTGNHDDILEDYEAIYPIKNPRFKIIRRHYPDKQPRYVQVGDLKYFFLHGHQFDKFFIWVGPLSRLPGFMAALNQTLISFFPPRGWGLPLLLALSILTRVISKSFPNPLIIFFLGLISLPRLFTYLQGTIWRRFGQLVTNKPKHLDISGLVDKNYYNKKKDTMTASVIVFGHTHIPEISSPEITKKLGKTLINTGSWISDNISTEKNTLLSIDRKGAMLLKWEGPDIGLSLIDDFRTP